MNILYVVHQFFPHHYTGTERLTFQLAKQVQRMGHLVSILTCEPSNINDEGYVPLESHIKKKIYFIDSIPIISFQNREDGINFDIFHPKIEKYLDEIIRDYDLVHFVHPMRNGSVLKICKARRIPTVLTLTDNWLLCPQGLITIDYELCDGPEEGKKCMDTCHHGKNVLERYKDAKSFLENVDAVFTGTEFVRQTFQENNWKREIEINKFSVDYSYIEENKEPNELVFAFMGTIAWHKGLHILIDAFKKVRGQKVKLKIYGEGDEKSDYVKSLYKLSKDDNRIEFCGRFMYKDLAKIMKNISVIIIPSVYKEIYPLVMETGFAFKKPVIASNIGGIPESVKDNINGFLFEVGNVDQLSDILNRISDDPELIKKLKQNIKQPPHIEEEALTYTRIYEELAKIYYS